MSKDWTQVANVERAMQHLAGLARGVAIDGELTDGELGGLTEWLSMHHAVLARPPFDELTALLERVMSDQHVDDDEREEVLDWCQRFASHDSVAVKTQTDAIRRLHGVLHGLAADGVVSTQEAIDLQDWMYDHEDVAHVWPFCDLQDLLGRILADRRVDDAELSELLTFCAPFVEREADGDHGGPVGHTLTHVCDHGAAISFEGRTFLFTGKAARPRKELHALVEARGGVPIGGIRRDLDYLVIGGLSQPAWAFASYGRKIEEVLELRRTGAHVAIVHEHALATALGLGK